MFIAISVHVMTGLLRVGLISFRGKNSMFQLYIVESAEESEILCQACISSRILKLSFRLARRNAVSHFSNG